MKESQSLIEVLKKFLKAKGSNYKDVASWLGLSEASVKRLFANGDFTLYRLEIICQNINISLGDLVLASKSEIQESQHLYTYEQEKFFSENPKYLAFFDLLLRNGTLQKVRKARPQLSDSRISTYLKKLEQMGLIERQVKDQIKFVVSKNVVWNKDGPLRKTFLNWAKEDFIDNLFSEHSDFFRFLSLELSESTAKKINRKLEDLGEEIHYLSELDRQVKVPTKNHGVLLGMRPWIFSILEEC